MNTIQSGEKMGHYLKKLRRLRIPLYAYSSTIAFVLLCLCIIILLAFFFVSKEMKKAEQLKVDYDQIPKIVKYQLETQSAPLFALAESHIAKCNNIHDIIKDQNLRAEFVHVHAPTFRFSNQVYNIGYFLEDGSTIFFISLEHINRLGMTNSLSPELKSLIKSIKPPQFTKYILFTSPPHETNTDINDTANIAGGEKEIVNVANKKGLLEFYGSHDELIEARTSVNFIDTNSFPYYASTINARSHRISRPYISHLAKAPAVSLSYPIRETIQNAERKDNAHERFRERYESSEQVIKGVYAITLHFDPTLLHNEIFTPEASIFILNDDLTNLVSAQPAQSDVAILEKCHTNTIVNGTHIVHTHNPANLMQGNLKSLYIMMQDFLTFNRELGPDFRKNINTVNFNGYDFNYYFTSAMVHGKPLNLLVWNRSTVSTSEFTFFDLGIFFLILALFLIACNFYIIYKKTIAVVALASEARRLASYDFSIPPSITYHSTELIGLHRSLATIRLILIDAFKDSPYKDAIKFNITNEEVKSKKYPTALPKEDLDSALIQLEEDFINGKFTEEQYIQAKLYYKQRIIKEHSLLINASPINSAQARLSNAHMSNAHQKNPTQQKINEAENNEDLEKQQDTAQKNNAFNDNSFIDFGTYNEEDFHEEDYIREEIIGDGYYIHRRETPQKENTLLPHSGVTPNMDRRVKDRRKNESNMLLAAEATYKKFMDRRKGERRNSAHEPTHEQIYTRSKELKEQIEKSEKEASTLVQQFDDMFATNLFASSTQKKDLTLTQNNKNSHAKNKDTNSDRQTKTQANTDPSPQPDT